MPRLAWGCRVKSCGRVVRDPKGLAKAAMEEGVTTTGVALVAKATPALWAAVVVVLKVAAVVPVVATHADCINSPLSCCTSTFCTTFWHKQSIKVSILNSIKLIRQLYLCTWETMTGSLHLHLLILSRRVVHLHVSFKTWLQHYKHKNQRYKQNITLFCLKARSDWAIDVGN